MSTRLYLTLMVILFMCWSVHGHCHKPKDMRPCNLDYCTENKKPCEPCCFCKKLKGEMRCHRYKRIGDGDDIKASIANFVGCRLKVHREQFDDPTIGYGFSLKRADAKQVINELFPNVDYDELRAGREQLTKEQAWELFCYSVDEMVKKAKRIFGDLYNKLPWNVKAAIVNALFRGDMGSKTIALIKAEKWEDVSKEYLNHDGYKEAKGKNQSGIVSRMNCNAWQFDSMVPGRHKCK